jgi:diacylglycerol kinase family enzyme
MHTLEDFAGYLSEICLHSLVLPGRPLRWTLIANPAAGGFTINRRWKKHEAILKACTDKAWDNPLRSDAAPSDTAAAEGKPGSLGLIATNGKGRAAEIAEALIREASKDAENRERPFHLIVTAGGDGTSLEALTRLFYAPPAIREQFAVLRLPMGTGTDGADSWDLDKALGLLIRPSSVKKIGAVRLSASGGNKGPFLAFNILSVGLDAFVTHMTNKMKGKLPGDSYKLWVDIAALFYDRIYKVGFLDVKAFDKAGGEAVSFRDKLLLLAVGATGRRTYGSHKWILPDSRNVCAVRQMSLPRKIALKSLFTTGAHVNKEEALLFNADRIEFSGERPILAQMDGETVLLEPGDFPALIELTEPAINVLTAGD